jgi:hypothetical protein
MFFYVCVAAIMKAKISVSQNFAVFLQFIKWEIHFNGYQKGNK